MKAHVGMKFRFGRQPKHYVVTAVVERIGGGVVEFVAASQPKRTIKPGVAAFNSAAVEL